MIRNDPVALPGLLTLLVGLAAFAVALVAARRRRGREAAGPPASRSRASLVGIVVQMLALLLIGAGPVRLVLPAGAPLAVVEAIVVALLMAGAVGLFTWASRAMGRNWSLVARTRSDHLLVRNGPFAHVRHPIYTGLALFALAMAVAYGHLSHLWIGGPLYALGTWMRVREEERLLRARFGIDYDAYAAQVPRFVPGLRRRHAA